MGGQSGIGWLRSPSMIEQEDRPRDLSSLVVPRVGSLVETGDLFEPYRLVDPSGLLVAAVAGYLRDLQAAGRPATTQRSYGMVLLRWFRFLRTVEVAWNQATRMEARDFCRWIQIADKPVWPHWRSRDENLVVVPRVIPASTPELPNSVTGKRAPGPRLTDIRDNLIARIDETQREGWIGEAERLRVSLTAANTKLAQLDGLAARRKTAVHLGMPAFPAVAGHTVTAPTTLPTNEETP